MSRTDTFLTPKEYYRMLTANHAHIKSEPLLSEKRTNYTSLARFWWGFLSDFAPGEVLDPIFNTGEGRSRSLSNIMNRSEYSSFPLKLHRAITAELNPDSILGLAHWLDRQIVQEMEGARLHETITAWEEVWLAEDVQLMPHGDFFRGMRPDLTEPENKLRFVAMLRLAWLGMYAVFGRSMSDPALVSLQSEPACSVEVLWGRRLVDGGLVQHPPQREAGRTYADTFPDMGTVWQELSDYLDSVPCPMSADPASRPSDGWYVVANWTDEGICLNDAPAPDYRGARMLTFIPNGSVLYVTMAAGYDGLHKSPGVWGYTAFQSFRGFIPMNLLVRLHLP